MQRLFFVRAIPSLKLNVAVVLERGGGQSPVPPAITPNHGPPNRLLWIPERKNNFSSGHVTSKAENDNAIRETIREDRWEQSFVNTQPVVINCA